ncbi:MAG: fumarylacetoacetate hydrolase family protein [Bdellovibrionaceae bacterium]|nr:fumarylacetoacetate hydrolase family protein [Pseudobdellovibrionaceae bacterium]
MSVWCVGRNYSEHAKELGNSIPDKPLFFLKSSATVHHGTTMAYPDGILSLHHELELAFRFDQHLRLSHIALALDLTDRQRQNELKAKGEPWTLAKSFKNACPISPWIPFDSNENYSFELYINEQKKQAADQSLMIFKWPQLVSFLKLHFPLAEGDILLSGTPAGVGSIHRGDTLKSVLKNAKQQILIEWTLKIE